MTASTPQKAAKATSPVASNALHNPEDFSLWAEAVRQQMLDALQKRQRRR
ncbi:MAG: hypothetical protein HC929_03125 [Leptolyngbyaceae cyanobacterium SM2_5_2]|nr:hypothetical protein [Leptolyngbyaceae cyanobacterium SM2_5_2]